MESECEFPHLFHISCKLRSSKYEIKLDNSHSLIIFSCVFLTGDILWWYFMCVYSRTCLKMVHLLKSNVIQGVFNTGSTDITWDHLYYETILFCSTTVGGNLTSIMLQATSVTKTYQSYFFNVDIFRWFREIHQTKAIHFESFSMTLLSYFVVISTETGCCYSSRCTLQWIFHHVISENGEV